MSSVPYQPRPKKRRKKKTTRLAIFGMAILGVWTLWWIATFQEFRLLEGERTWIPSWTYIGYDLEHNHMGAEFLLEQNENPYTNFFGDTRGRYSYAPITLVFFLWAGWIPFVPGAILFALFIATVVGLGMWWASKIRKKLDLFPLPLPFLIAAGLISMPVMFAMERGNCDVLVLGMIMIATLALRMRKNFGSDSIVGVALGIGAMIKIYPLVLMLGLVALRRLRALGFMIGAIVLITLLTWTYSVQWYHNMTEEGAAQERRTGPIAASLEWLKDPNQPQPKLKPFVSESAHSLSDGWGALVNGLRINAITNIPGPLAAGVFTMSLALWVSWRVFKCERRLELRLPYLLYLASLATYWMPFSFDYNLIYMPIAIFAVWDRRDPVWVHMLYTPSLLVWWQPFMTTIGDDTLLGFKVAALLGLTFSLVNRLNEITGQPASAEDSIPTQDQPLAEPLPQAIHVH